MHQGRVGALHHRPGSVRLLAGGPRRRVHGERLDGCDPDPEEFDGYVTRPCWRQPYGLDAFGADGRFLGSFELPAEIRIDIEPYIRDHLMLALAEDTAGAIMVKRYRLVLPGER